MLLVLLLCSWEREPGDEATTYTHACSHTYTLTYIGTAIFLYMSDLCGARFGSPQWSMPKRPKMNGTNRTKMSPLKFFFTHTHTSPPYPAHLIPAVFKSQAWGVLHALLEIIVFRVHLQLQYSYRFQLLQQLHTVASVSIIPSQLYSSTENAALRLIKGLVSSDFLIQLAKQFSSDPKPVRKRNSCVVGLLLIDLQWIWKFYHHSMQLFWSHTHIHTRSYTHTHTHSCCQQTQKSWIASLYLLWHNHCRFQVHFYVNVVCMWKKILNFSLSLSLSLSL